jgi:hypothetical protein
MSVLVLGADNVSSIVTKLSSMGVTRVLHWTMRKSGEMKKEIPQSVEAMIFLTDFLNHNAMKRYKNLAKSRNIPFVCAKRSECSVCEEFSKISPCCLAKGCKHYPM